MRRRESDQQLKPELIPLQPDADVLVLQILLDADGALAAKALPFEQQVPCFRRCGVDRPDIEGIETRRISPLSPR